MRVPVFSCSPFAFPLQYVRREIRSLTETHRVAFFDAMETLYRLPAAEGAELYGDDYKVRASPRLLVVSLCHRVEHENTALHAAVHAATPYRKHVQNEPQSRTPVWFFASCFVFMCPERLVVRCEGAYTLRIRRAILDRRFACIVFTSCRCFFLPPPTLNPLGRTNCRASIFSCRCTLTVLVSRTATTGTTMQVRNGSLPSPAGRLA